MKVLLVLLIVLQVFVFTTYAALEDGSTYKITNVGAVGKVLEVSRDNSGSIKAGHLTTATSDDGANQRFTLEYVGSGYYKIIVKDTSKCLTSLSPNGKTAANFEEQTCTTNNKSQQFSFTCVGTDKYVIKSRSCSKYLEAQSGARKFVYMYSRILNCPWQTWIFEKIPDCTPAVEIPL